MSRWLLSIGSVLLLLLASISTASAHAYLEQSSPAPGAELSESPTEIRVKFTEPIDSRLSRLVLTNETTDERIEATQSGEGDEYLLLAIPLLEDGVYRVDWQVLAIDTHITDGSFRFSVGVELPQEGPADTISFDDIPEENPQEETPQGESSNRFITFLIAGIATVGAGIGILLLVLLRRK